ncbi:Volume-regulated anion channel subunit LRRC8E [Exaiptasia diaphana]|nr:Volume-regulated anion channel subunit LRRC8E [Exaiptasia diaphana]
MMIGMETPKPDAGMKLLTPWWDLLKRYLTAGIMTIALSTVALQAAKDNLVCIPAVKCKGATAITQDMRFTNTCKEVLKKLENDSWKEVMTTMVDRRQYDFVDSLCYQNSLEFYPTYFPFILVGMAVLLLAINNIWVMYPKTSSTLNHFVSLTMECYNSVGTNSDISRILDGPTNNAANNGAANNVAANNGAANNGTALDSSEVMKVKTLYAKVEQFKDHFDKKNLLIQLEKSFECRLDNVFNTPYQYFVCARFIAPYYQAATVIFGVAVALFFMLSLCTLCWALHVRVCRLTDFLSRGRKPSHANKSDSSSSACCIRKMLCWKKGRREDEESRQNMIEMS